jgi:hypothetical protein
MRRRATLLFALAIAGAPGRFQAAPPTPIVVELFTSEGCSSCPSADALLQRLVDTQPVGGAQIIGLGQHVDYWDELGWKDRFSSSALTERQQAYAARFNNESAYTPQMVVDGRAAFVGSDAAAAKREIELQLHALHGTVRIALQPAAGRVDVSVTATDLPRIGRGDRADVLVAVTEDQVRSDVKRGENHGRILVHAAVVRFLGTIGEASADGPSAAHADVALGQDWHLDHVRLVAFVQERRSRTILGSAIVLLKNARP